MCYVLAHIKSMVALVEYIKDWNSSSMWYVLAHIKPMVALAEYIKDKKLVVCGMC
jgi:hypothetical protein